MYLDSSRLSVNGSLWAPYFKSFVENSSAGDTGVNFNPSHLFPLSRLSPMHRGRFYPLPLILPPSPKHPTFPLCIPILLPSSESGSHSQRSEWRKGGREGVPLSGISPPSAPLCDPHQPLPLVGSLALLPGGTRNPICPSLPFL